MSQHNFYTDELGINVRVIMGWDKPLSQFYMVLFDETNKDDEDDEGQLLYSNVDDESAFLTGVDLEYFVAILKDRYGITPPTRMISEIRSDKITNVVNRVEIYGGYN